MISVYINLYLKNKYIKHAPRINNINIWIIQNYYLGYIKPKPIKYYSWNFYTSNLHILERQII